METAYSIHGHARSLSSLASSILPMPSDASTFTSVTASPMDPQDAGGSLMELDLSGSSDCCKRSLQEKESTTREVRKLDTDDSKSNAAVIEALGNQTNLLDFKSDPIERSPQSHQDHQKSCHYPSTLEHLTSLVSTARWQKRRASNVRKTKNHLSLSYGLRKRLSKTLWVAHGNLIDQYKIEDQAGFGGLYEACDQIAAHCQWIQNGCQRRELSADDIHSGVVRSPEDRIPWIHRLPADDRQIILTLLTKIRTEPAYLADRIASLSPSELTALTSSYHPAGIDLSILANHSYGVTHLYSQDSQMFKLSRRMDNLQRFHTQDPFFILMYCCFNIWAKPNSGEYSRRNAVWSSICASVIKTSRAGSDEFIIAAADAFLGLEDWKLKPRLETYIMDVLTRGSFLLETSPVALEDGLQDGEAETMNSATKEREFFESAVTDLLAILASDLTNNFLPKPVLDFIRSTILQIPDRDLQLKAKIFFVTRWYFASHMSSILMFPELHGLAMTFHIGSMARRRILNEIVVRMQVQVFDVLGSSDDRRNLQPNRAEIIAICDCFEPIHFCQHWSPPDPNAFRASSHDYQEDEVMLSAEDISTIIQALYPQELESANFAESTLPTPPSTTSSSTLPVDPNDTSIQRCVVDQEGSSSSVFSDRTIVADETHDDVCLPDPRASMPDLNPQENSTEACELSGKALWNIRQTLLPTTKPSMESQGNSVVYDWSFFRSASIGTVSIDPLGEAAESWEFLFNPHTQHPVPLGGPQHELEYLKAGIVELLSQSDDTDTFTGSHQQRPNRTLNMTSLYSLLEKKLASAELEYDGQASLYWWNIRSLFVRLTAGRDQDVFLDDLLDELARELQLLSRYCASDAEEGESEVRSLSRLAKYSRAHTSRQEQERRSLRIKLWYVCEVRHSSTHEEARLVTQALHAMKLLKRKTATNGTFKWARQRLKTSFGQNRAVKQALEAVAAPSEFGDLSKLADHQIDMTSKWMAQDGIQNFCNGEEKIHKFCHQIQRSVNRLVGPNFVDSPVLWSSNLFKREKSAFMARPSRYSEMANCMDLPRSTGTLSSNTGLRLSTSEPRLPNYSIPPPTDNSFLDAGFGHSKGLQYHIYTGESDHPFINNDHPNSDNSDKVGASTSSGRRAIMFAADGSCPQSKNDFLQSLKQSLFGLLSSDLGPSSSLEQSETDTWINRAIEFNEGDASPMVPVDPLTSSEINRDETRPTYSENATSISSASEDKSVPSGVPPSAQSARRDPMTTAFPFRHFYKTLFQRVSLTHDPTLKLQLLRELLDLVKQDVTFSSETSSRSGGYQNGEDRFADIEMIGRRRNDPQVQVTAPGPSINDQEAQAQLRQGLANHILRQTSLENSLQQIAVVDDDAVMQKLLSIIRDPDLRSSTLYKDLQLISAFVPAKTLNQTPPGKAFWSIALAALALKDELCSATIRRATLITNAHIHSKTGLPSPGPSLQDAAQLWVIAAKEGSVVAARELGLFYLTHPDLIPRTTKPFSKSQDVFRSAAGTDRSLYSTDTATENRESGALDPLTFAVVFHWMEIAAGGGDEEAKAFLRQGQNM